MSEFINNNADRIDLLFQFCKKLIKGKNNKALIADYQEVIDDLQPNDIVVVVHRLVEENLPISDLKIGINKALNVFYKSILKHPKPEPDSLHFLGVMMSENRELEKYLSRIKPLVKKINLIKDISTLKNELLVLKGHVNQLGEMEKHYSRKENILFPYFESQYPDFKCLSVMWSIHDDIRKVQKQLLAEFDQVQPNLKQINALIGDLFFFMHAIIFREEYLLFPVALHAVSTDLWQEMNRQSLEIGFSFIEAPDFKFSDEDKPTNTSQIKANELDLEQLGNTQLNFETGLMKLEQAMLLLNHLPVDITMIDEEDRVRYFSKPKDRFFTRSKAIIGRTVQNCHPPESVHVVDELLKEFKSGNKDSEPFWIQMQGRFILIQYFALRDDKGKYKGCIEVSQDLTEIKKLEGEKRLMD